MNKPFMPVEHVTPTRMGHVVFFVPKDRAREISDSIPTGCNSA